MARIVEVRTDLEAIFVEQALVMARELGTAPKQVTVKTRHFSSESKRFDE